MFEKILFHIVVFVQCLRWALLCDYGRNWLASCIIYIFVELSKAATIAKTIRVQSSLDISNTDISKFPLKSKNVVLTIFYFQLNFKFMYVTLLISHSKFSGTRKFTVRYQ